MKWILLVMIAITAIVALHFGMRRARDQIASRFSMHPSIPPAEFYMRYYANSGIAQARIGEIVNHVASELSLPAQKLLPTDRFDNEMSPPKGWNWDAGSGILTVELQRLAKQRGVSIDYTTILTLDDYLRIAAPLWDA